MNNVLCSILVLVACLAPLAAAPDEKAPKAQLTRKASSSGLPTTANGCFCLLDTA
jgi:hypothetical protein